MPGFAPGCQVRHYALKSKSFSGRNYWPLFIEEGVVAIGCPKINTNPLTASEVELRNEIARFPEYRDPDAAARGLKKFAQLQPGDLLLICDGYAPNQAKDVHIYGFARVEGPFMDGPRHDDDWRFKHKAVVQAIDRDVPKDLIAVALGKGSLRSRIHSLDSAVFAELERRLAPLGVHRII